MRCSGEEDIDVCEYFLYGYECSRLCTNKAQTESEM